MRTLKTRFQPAKAGPRKLIIEKIIVKFSKKTIFS